jgi:hypothetical protein
MTKRLHPLSFMLRCKLLQHAQRTFNAQRTLHAQLFPPVENPKRPTRSQNLSERFRRLEKMVLAKHNLNQTITHAPRVPQRPRLSLPTASRHSTPTTFRGLVIPEIPKAPEPDGEGAHPATTASFLCAYRVLHVWLRRLRVRFIPRITGHLQNCGRLCPCLSYVHGRTRGTMAREYPP